MRKNLLLLIIALLFVNGFALSQTVKIHGKVTNAKLEPQAFVSIQVKELKYGTITKEDGTYEMDLETGKYDLVYTMIGYNRKPAVVPAGLCIELFNRRKILIVHISFHSIPCFDQAPLIISLA